MDKAIINKNKKKSMLNIERVVVVKVKYGILSILRTTSLKEE
jgi:hypothetical protein